MADVLDFPPQTKRERLIASIVHDRMGRDELVRECRNLERHVMRLEDGIAAIADAAWPQDRPSERPDEPDAGFTAEDVIAGVRSLHELTDRLCVEQARSVARGAAHERARVVKVLGAVRDSLQRGGDVVGSQLLDGVIEEIG